MTEEQGKAKYVNCCQCKCKYINDDDNIKKDFGYNRLNEIYKTCVKCREYRKLRFKRLKDEATASEGKVNIATDVIKTNLLMNLFAQMVSHTMLVTLA